MTPRPGSKSDSAAKKRRPKPLNLYDCPGDAHIYLSHLFQDKVELVDAHFDDMTSKDCRKLATWLNKAADYLEAKEQRGRKNA